MAWSTRRLAQLAGTTIKTIRHYHDIGLLDEPERAANGYKQYSTPHLVRILHIAHLRDLGMELAQIATVDDSDEAYAKTLHELDARLAESIAHQQQLRAEIDDLLRHRAAPDAPAGYADLAGSLTSADRAMVMVSAQLFDAAGAQDMKDIVAGHRDAGSEFDVLGADASADEVHAVALSLAPPCWSRSTTSIRMPGCPRCVRVRQTRCEISPMRSPRSTTPRRSKRSARHTCWLTARPSRKKDPLGGGDLAAPAAPGALERGRSDPSSTDPAERRNPLDARARRCESRAMSTHEHARAAWEDASQKHVLEYAEHLEQARTARLFPIEERLLAPLLVGAEVLHPQSGHGLDDHALGRLGARSVHGLDYSPTAVRAAQRRADELGAPCRYEVAELPATGLDGGIADLVYTGKGALILIEDLAAWAAEMHRLLRPGGHLFLFEAHPLVPLWAWDTEEARVRADRSCFAPSHVNDTFPARGATEHQRTLAQTVMGILGAGFELLHLAEHPEPFWRPEGEAPAAAWDGRVPNTFSLLTRRS